MRRVLLQNFLNVIAVHPKLSTSSHFNMFLIGDEDKFQEVKKVDASTTAEWVGAAVESLTGSPKSVRLWDKLVEV